MQSLFPLRLFVQRDIQTDFQRAFHFQRALAKQSVFADELALCESKDNIKSKKMKRKLCCEDYQCYDDDNTTLKKKKRTVFTCEECGDRFMMQSQLTVHVNGHRSGKTLFRGLPAPCRQPRPSADSAVPSSEPSSQPSSEPSSQPSSEPSRQPSSPVELSSGADIYTYIVHIYTYFIHMNTLTYTYI